MADAADVGQGSALRGPPGHSLLRSLWHRPVLPRGGPGLPRRGRPVDLRSVPLTEATARGRRRSPRVDHHALDAHLQRRRRGRRRHRPMCGSPIPAADVTWCGRAGTARATPTRPVRRAPGGADLVGLALPPTVRRSCRRTSRRQPGGSWPTTSSPPTMAPASCTWPQPSARTTPDRSRRGPAGAEPGRRRGAFDHDGPAVDRPVREGRRPRHHRRSGRRGVCSCAR